MKRNKNKVGHQGSENASRKMRAVSRRIPAMGLESFSGQIIQKGNLGEGRYAVERRLLRMMPDKNRGPVW